MRASLPTLRLLLGSLTFLFLVACTSDDNDVSQSDEINTFNFFVNDQSIYSFNSETTEFARLLTSLDVGDNQHAFMDTDEDKQGYEYLAYVENNAIYLLDYNKDNNGKVTLIKAVSGTICGIFPQLIASEAAFNSDLTGREITHAKSMTIVTANGANCDHATNFFDSLDFSQLIDDDTQTNTVRLSSLNSALFYGDNNGDNIINFSSAPKLDTDTNRTVGLSGFLGYDLEGQQIQFTYTNSDKIDRNWRSQKAYNDTTIPTILQASKAHAIIQIDDNLFVTAVDTLFNINENTNSPSSTQSLIDALFETTTATLNSSTAITINKTMALDRFLVKSDDRIYIYQDSALNEFLSLGLADASNFNDDDNVSDNEYFDLMSPGLLILIKEVNGKQILSYSKPSTTGPTGVLDADKIEFKIINNELFVNTLNSQTNSGWETHWFKDEAQLNKPETHTTYPNSRFIFAEDTRQEAHKLFLLSSDIGTSDGKLLIPSLYKFDKTHTTGRLQERDEDKALDVDFSFGQFNVDVENTLEAEIINDEYGRLKLTGSATAQDNEVNVGDNVEVHYFFNPSQTSALKAADMSLKRMHRTVVE